MNFNQFFKETQYTLQKESIDFIFEGIQDNLGQSAAILRGSNKSKEAVDDAKKKIQELSDALTAQYVDLPPNEGGQHTHLPILVKWIKDGEPLDRIKSEYDTYMRLPKEIKSNFNLKKMNSFKQFFELVHKYNSKTIAQSSGDISNNETLETIRHDKDVQEAKRYEDENITIYEGTDLQTTRKLSCKSKYGFCIGVDPESGNNYFHHYRIDNNQTTYFVFFKNEESKKNYNWMQNDKGNDLLIIDVKPDKGWLEITDTDNNPQKTNWKNVLQKFPVLQKPYNENVFKWTEPDKKAFVGMSSSDAYEYARNVLQWKNVPQEIMQSIIKDPQYASEYARNVLQWKNVPQEIMQSIIKAPMYAYYYASDVLKGQNVPEEIMQSISKDPQYAYYYAKNVLKGQNVPQEIMQSIIKAPMYAYGYARDVLKWKNVPQEIMQSIIKAPMYAYYYASDVLKGQNVPQEIVQNISKAPMYAYYYASDVLKGQNVPQEIVQSISKDPKYASEYAEYIKNQQPLQEFHIKLRKILIG